MTYPACAASGSVASAVHAHPAAFDGARVALEVGTAAGPSGAAGPTGPAGPAEQRGCLAARDPRALVLICLAFPVVAVTTPAPALAAFGCYAAMAVGLLLLARAPLPWVALRLVRLLPMILLIALPVLFWPAVARASAPPGVGVAAVPAIAWQGVHLPRAELLLCWSVAAKAALGLTALLTLQFLVPFESLLWSLDRLGLPRTFVTMLQLTRRYGGLLQTEAERMNTARRARGYAGRWLWQAGSTGHLIGTLFLRSVDRAERVHQAMLARGFDGVALTGARNPSPGGGTIGGDLGDGGDGAQPRWQFADSVTLVGALLLILAVRMALA
ncbi:MAG: energy-coupling factor transporter transmembrane component T [Planctomycetota bacterium]